MNILDHVMDRDTDLVIFSSTVKKDSLYRSQVNKYKRKGYNVTTHPDLYAPVKGGKPRNILEDMIEDGFGDGVESKSVRRAGLTLQMFGGLPGADPQQSPRDRHTIIVIDDLNFRLKDKVLASLLTRHRHLKCSVIILSQAFTHLQPSSRDQMDFIVVFKNIRELTLRSIYDHAELSVEYEEFRKAYRTATSAKWGFLVVDIANNQLRNTFRA